MPLYLITPLYTAIFALIVIAVIPKEEIKRLAVYGIFFGALLNILTLLIGSLTGKYCFINFEPLGISFIPFFPPISWTLFFMLYFYFMPKKPWLYIYAASGIFYSILFGNMITNLGIFKLSHRLLLPLIAFTIWFSIATWGYLRLTSGKLRKPEI